MSWSTDHEALAGFPIRKAVILDPGRHLSDFVKLTLHGVECVSRPSIAEALKETGAQVCLCGIVLTKIETRSAVSEAIRALSGCFPIVIFYEPCSLNHNRLGAQGLTSFHSHFTSNKMFGVLDMAMFVGALSGCPTCRVVHFGQNLAVDTDAAWLVPANYPSNTLPSSLSTRSKLEYQLLDFLAFEFSWFVCYRFDSPSEISVGDWSLIETVRLATNMQCIKTFLKENGAAQTDITEVPVDAVMAYRRADAYRMPAQASFGASIDAASSGSDAVTSAFDSYRKSFAGRNASIRLLFMEDAFVSGTGIVFTPRSIVKDSSYLYDIHARSVWGAIHRGTSRQLLLSPDCYDVCVVGLNAAAGNYYHWISQCLVAIQTGIEAARKRQAVRIAVLVPTLNQWQKDSLDALLGDSRGLRVIQLKLSEFVHVHHALYVSTLGEDAPFFNHAERAITATVIKKALRLTPRLPSHGIYISRRDTGKRRIVNELDLIAALAQFGIHEVVMSQLPFTDQIGVIHGAGLVVGAHGAGLTNIMFAQPGAMLYEIHQAGYLNPCMLRLAHSVGAHYISDIFCEATSEKFSHAGDWRVDVATIVATIRRIAAAWNTLDVASEARGGEAQ